MSIDREERQRRIDQIERENEALKELNTNRNYRPQKDPPVKGEEAVLLETNRILNQIGINRKIRINLLVWRLGMSYGEAEDLVGPEKASDY